MENHLIFEGALACPAEGVSDVANSVYHEARHAEQKHLLMRMKAGELKSEPAYAIVATEASYISSLSAQYHVHKDAVNHAFQTPIATTHPFDSGAHRPVEQHVRRGRKDKRESE